MNKVKLLFLACLLTMTVFFSWGVILISKNISTASDIYRLNNYNNGTKTQDNTQQYGKSLNVLILGLDDGGFRSDVIMLMNYKPLTGEIKLMSVPRDTMVRYKGSTGKINALYTYGKERLIKNTIEQFMGLKIDYYITADLSGFRRIIDTLGGVFINVPINMDYDDPQQGLSIHLKKGYQLLNGKKAEDFVRYRKSSMENGKEIGDIGRIESQGQLIKELLRQKINLKYISKADEILSVLIKSIKTNMALNDVKYYMPYLVNISAGKVEAYTVPGQPSMIGDVWYYLTDTDKTSEIIRDNFATAQK